MKLTCRVSWVSVPQCISLLWYTRADGIREIQLICDLPSKSFSTSSIRLFIDFLVDSGNSSCALVVACIVLSEST